jgi:Putative phage serine protease XkdF
MNTTKIIELFIDEEYEEAGIEAISLVSSPAHEERWMAFNRDKCSCGSHKMEEDVIDEYTPYRVVADDFCNHHPKLATLGEPVGELEKEGWEIVRIEKITPQVVHQMNQHKFSDPNSPSFLDTDNYRVRFKYVGPRDRKNRQFCAQMLSFNRVYRQEDIDELTDTVANEEFGFYNIFLWRGSFNCRHTWVRLIYKKEGKIINSGSSSRGLESTDAQSSNLQPDTRTQATIDSANPEKQWKPGMPRTGPNLFAEGKGLEDACWEGYEAIGLKDDGSPNCVPIKMTEDDFAESITDYPEGVKNAAKKAVDWAEENGWGSCGTQVGKTRASQLANGEPISVDTLKRMYSYLSRHKADLTSSKSYEDGCGKLMYDAWGGEAGLTYAERKLKQLENMKMVFSVVDEEKKIIVGAAMVPNKMIHRYDDLGNLYYVFFSKESIKKMADKFLKEKRTDETSIEHNGLKLGSDKVYITESWVSEDPIYDKSNKYGFELPAGTWFVSMKVNDDKVWKLIKEKALTGYSVEGLFAEKSVFSKEDKQINQIKQLLKSIKDYDK